MELIRFLLKASRPMVILIVLASVVSGGLSAALIAVVNRALATNGVHLWTIMLAFVVVVVARMVTQFISAVLLMRFAQDTVLKLSRVLCERTLSSPFVKVEAMGTPRVLAVLTEDVAGLSAAVLALPTVATNLAMLAGCSIYLAWLSWKVFAICAVLAALGVLGHRVLLRRAQAAVVAAREGRDRLISCLPDADRRSEGAQAASCAAR